MPRSAEIRPRCAPPCSPYLRTKCARRFLSHAPSLWPGSSGFSLPKLTVERAALCQFRLVEVEPDVVELRRLLLGDRDTGLRRGCELVRGRGRRLFHGRFTDRGGGSRSRRALGPFGLHRLFLGAPCRDQGRDGQRQHSPFPGKCPLHSVPSFYWMHPGAPAPSKLPSG